MGFSRSKEKNLGLAARKLGMTRLFREGKSFPVTVLFAKDNRVAQIKTDQSDGYTAVQLAFSQRRRSRVNKPLSGHFAKAGIEAGEVLKEFRVDPDQAAKLSLGEVIEIDKVFRVDQQIRIQGRSKGKGFAGTIKRHNFNSGRASHGNSRAHNVPGSIGMTQDPGRVFRGKRMSGHMGNAKRTIHNLRIMKIDAARGLLWVKGAVPGATHGIVIITSAIYTDGRMAEGAQ